VLGAAPAVAPRGLILSAISARPRPPLPRALGGRTKRRVSRPHAALTAATLAVVVAAFLLPYTPVASLLDFQPLSARFLLALAGILAAYLLSAELMKRLFYRWAAGVSRGAAGDDARGRAAT
jgi:hypothetical protein